MNRLRWVSIGIRAIGLALLVIGLAGCEQEQPKAVTLANRAPLSADAQPSSRTKLNLAVGSIITPEQGYAYYQQLIDYLAESFSLDITIVDPGNYDKLNYLLETGKVDVAFVCSSPYVEGHQRFGLELLAAPVVNGAPVYYSDLIVPAGSPVQTLADLRGKTFAFTDPNSNSGSLVPKAQLARMGVTAKDFFLSTTYTYAHDRSIHAVAEGLVEGAAVDSLIYDYLAATEPELNTRVRIVERYGPYGIPPVVAAPHVAAELRETVRQGLLTMHETPKGREILQAMHIERFETIDDSAYESVRQLLTPVSPDSR
ncbi:phosphate/phosphite/phosphonate ABC transporter substrate-binding protein [Trichloromonas sp.]|uniref:substrate-binding domain-containing protein n=1 Tax=Trichloromonas sp. TaxID=3069249 RepID=UPI003D81BE2F